MSKEELKQIYKFNTKGELNLSKGSVIETDSKGELNLVNIIDKLSKLDGKFISISIKEETELPIE